MRFTILFSLGLGLLAADSAVAGPCRPSVTASSSSTAVESTSVDQTTSATTAESSFTTTSVASVESPTKEATSSTETTSTSSAPVSAPTFTVLAGTSALKDGGQHNGIYIYDSARTDITAHTASIDPSTGRMVFSSGFFWKAQYTRDPTSPALVLNGDNSSGYGSDFPALTCTVGDDLKITCSAPAGECDFDDNCAATSGTWNTFCSQYDSVFGCPSGYSPITLQGQAV
ncbi:hypothetical protein QQX98_008396 [Neonectria punicea]|uniref:Uncharacterized protein n=1 Tax=Neonectria punicea TaxID=979145 RepID=A0ABR1GVM7_9HYPO